MTRIAPSFIKTIIKPTQKSLREFVDQLHTTYQNLSQAFNGGVSYGDGTNTENINGSWVNVVAPGVANTNFTVTHGLNRTPVGVHIMQKDRACDVWTVSSTKTTMTLQASVASAVLRLFIFGLILGLFSTRSEAQGDFYHDIAFQTANTAVGIVTRPVNGALITVCLGNTTTIPCSPATTIYSNQTLTNAQSNPFNADINGNFGFWATAAQTYTISITGVGLNGYNTVWAAPLVTAGSFGSAFFTTLTSNTVNPASTGSIRLAVGDLIGFRNNANSGDLFLTPNAFDQLNLASWQGIVSKNFTSVSLNSAATGTVRFATGDTLCWRNNANSADICLSKTSGDILQFGTVNETLTIGTGNLTSLGTLIGAGTCQSQGTVTITGAVTATDLATPFLNVALPATFQTGIRMDAQVTSSNTVTVNLCNPTAGGITPAATTINVKVIR